MRNEYADPDIVRRIQTAIDALPSPIFIKDGACRYIACYRAFETYIGVPRTSIIGATVYDDSGIDDIVRRADITLYEAKAAGRNAIRAHPGGR